MRFKTLQSILCLSVDVVNFTARKRRPSKRYTYYSKEVKRNDIGGPLKPYEFYLPPTRKAHKPVIGIHGQWSTLVKINSEMLSRR